MTKLKIEIGRYGSLVFGKILEQPEKMRDAGTIWVSKSFTIKTAAKPELTTSFLWLQGSNDDADHNVFYHRYCTDIKAAEIIKMIEQGIKEINEENVPAYQAPIVSLKILE